MSIKHHINDYVVFTKSDGEKYINVFNDFLSYNIKIIKVFRNIEDTKVLLIDTQYGKMILKIFAPKVKQNERFLKAMVKGDYYEKLFEQTERVRKEGLDSVNDFYLLAEKKTLRFAHYYIMLIEYIEGVELVDIPEIDDELKQKSKRQFQDCISMAWSLAIHIKATLSLKMVLSELSIYQVNRLQLCVWPRIESILNVIMVLLMKLKMLAIIVLSLKRNSVTLLDG